jgi:hypothetical protein
MLFDLINQLATLDYEEAKRILVEEIVPLTRDRTNLESVNWNQVTPDSLSFFFSKLVYKHRAIRSYNDRSRVDMILDVALNALDANATNTATLSAENRYDRFTLLENAIRSKHVSPRVITLLLYKHNVNVLHVGGASPSRQVDNWNENAFFLVVRELFRRDHTPHNKINFGKKLYILLNYCKNKRINIDAALQTQSLSTADTFSAKMMIVHYEQEWRDNPKLVSIFNYFPVLRQANIEGVN